MPPGPSTRIVRIDDRWRRLGRGGRMLLWILACDGGDGPKRTSHPTACVAGGEVCNGLDDDCDGLADDDPVDAVVFAADADGDGFGATEPQPGCPPPVYATVGGDCDD